MMGCHSEGHQSSKDKYRIQESKTKVKVIKKELQDKDDFVHFKSESGENFLVKKVWNNHKEQSCKNCHEGHSLKEMRGREHKRSHWNIKLHHASKKIMNCQTCHHKDEVWLFNEGTQAVKANHTPKLCSQCHFKQKRDWEAGSHGKRLTGWQYERAIKNCVSCHNPHSPGFEKRWPKVAPYRPTNNEERL